MKSDEARTVLAAHLVSYRARSYGELVDLIARGPDTAEIAGPSGARYQIEVIAAWDGSMGGDVHVMAAVDDGGWRACLPLTAGFIMRADGSFVGEQ